MITTEAWKEELYHHGILGMHWGIRRYQNEDGSLTEEGRRRLEKKDVKWAKKNYNKIYNKAYKESKKELDRYSRNELDERHRARNKDGSLSLSFAVEYNRKMAELMNTKVSDLRSPSGKAIQFVAKRGEIGVHMALTDVGYDLGRLKNGVYNSGKIAFKQETVNRT